MFYEATYSFHSFARNNPPYLAICPPFLVACTKKAPIEGIQSGIPSIGAKKYPRQPGLELAWRISSPESGSA